MIKFKLFACIGFTLLALFFTSLTFAGGGGVDTRVTNTDDPHAITVIVHFDPKLFTCKGMNVSFNFESSEDGDIIKGTNGDNTSTITQEAWMGKTRLKCFTHAIVYSKELKLNRTLNISFKGANLEGSRKIAVSFGVTYNPNDLPLLAWENPSDSEPIAPTSATCTDTDGGKNYEVVGSAVYTNNPDKILEEFDNCTSDNLLSEMVCNSSTDYRQNTESYYCPNGCQDGACKKELGNTDTTVPAPKIVDQPEVMDGDKNNELLEQKIANLEAQLNESKKDQSILAQRVNDLINFIKKLFPFFN